MNNETIYSSESISYNSSRVDDAIHLASKVNGSFGSGLLAKIKGVRIPANHKNYDGLSTTLYNLSSTLDSVSSLEATLKSMKDGAEAAIEHERIMNSFIEMNMEKEIIIENGVEVGYVFKPPGVSTDGLPMITYLSGIGTTSFDMLANDNSTTLFSNSIINGDLALNAVVYMPLQTGRYGYNAQILDGSLMNSIDSVAKKYNVDPNRHSLFGFSVGCLDGANLAAKYGDYFSFIALAGERIECMEELANNNPNAKFVLIDEGTIHGHRVNGFEEYFGNRDAVLYETITKSNSDPNHSSGFFLSENLLLDAMNVVRGKNYLTENRGSIINTCHTEFISGESPYVLFTGGHSGNNIPPRGEDNTLSAI